MTEPQLLAAVTDIGRINSWRCVHLAPTLRPDESISADVHRDGTGWPDLVMVRGKRIVAAELMTQPGPLAPDKAAWLDALAAAGAETYVWRPSDLPLVATLLSESHRPGASHRDG